MEIYGGFLLRCAKLMCIEEDVVSLEICLSHERSNIFMLHLFFRNTLVEFGIIRNLIEFGNSHVT